MDKERKPAKKVRGAPAEGGVTKVLLCEDEESFVDALVIGLTNEGFRVSVARDGAEALTLFEETTPDIILLDLMLPKISGIDVCRNIRARSSVPIIMVMAKGTEIDTVVALEVGADDYVTKPYRLRELVARIHAVLRRQSPSELPGAPSETTEVFEFGEFALNLATRTLTKAGQEIPLTTGEFSVLKVFARHPRQPLSREKLMELARGREYEVFDRSLDVQISRLRKLIEPDPGSPRFIQTVWGLGYVFIPDGAA